MTTTLDHEGRISHIEGKLDLLLQSQDKILDNHNEMMNLLREDSNRITKLETEKDFLTRVGSPFFSFIFAVVGAYFGKRIP